MKNFLILQMLQQGMHYSRLILSRCVLLIVMLTSLTLEAKVIVVQGAMDMEIEVLKQALQQPTMQQIGSWRFFKGQIGKHQVIISQTEIGLVNAAAATVLAIEYFQPDLIINQGTAGGHDPRLERGDIVVAKQYYNLGQLTLPSNPIHLSRQNSQPFKFILYYPKEFSRRVQQLSRITDKKIVTGTIASGDQWNRELDRIAMIHESTQSAIEEMESVAVAEVSESFNIPLLTIRILSNSEWHQQDFEPQTATQLQQIIIRFLNELE